MLLSRMGAFSWKGLQTSDSRYGWAAGVARVPGLRQAGSNEAGRVPFLSSHVDGAHDYVDPAWGGQERGSSVQKCTCQHLLRWFLSVALLPLVEKGFSFLNKEGQDDGPCPTPHNSQPRELPTPSLQLSCLEL